MQSISEVLYKTFRVEFYKDTLTYIAILQYLS